MAGVELYAFYHNLKTNSLVLEQKQMETVALRQRPKNCKTIALFSQNIMETP